MTLKNNSDEKLTIFFKVFDVSGNALNHGCIKIIFPDNARYCSEVIKDGNTKIDVPYSCIGKRFRIEPAIQGYQFISQDNSTLSASGQEFEVMVNKIRGDIPEEKSNSYEPELKRFAVLLSGELQYIQDIFEGFKETLKRELKKIGYQPDIKWRTGSDEPDSEETYRKRIEDFLGEGYDFYIPIGTQASEAMYKYFDERSNIDPLVFLGVTDPLGSRLVDSMKNREDKKSIAGVSYCRSVLEIAARIHRIFPDKKLIYIYHKGYKQDVLFAESLNGKRLEEDGILFLKEIGWPPSIEDFEDEGAIYFSWYTIEKMFESPEGRSILSQRNVVSSTIKNVKEKRAPIAITTDDRLIGQHGGKIIVDFLKNGIPLGKMDVHEPEIYCYVNCEIIKERNLDIKADVIENARARFDCD